MVRVTGMELALEGTFGGFRADEWLDVIYVLKGPLWLQCGERNIMEARCEATVIKQVGDDDGSNLGHRGSNIGSEKSPDPGYRT